jgi:hypothetical protein
MTASNQIFLVMDAGSPKAAFTTRHEKQAYLRRRLDAFIKPLVYTFWGNQGPSIMTLSWRCGHVILRHVENDLHQPRLFGLRRGSAVSHPQLPCPRAASPPSSLANAAQSEVVLAATRLLSPAPVRPWRVTPALQGLRTVIQIIQEPSCDALLSAKA